MTRTTKKDVKDMARLTQFMDHCCRVRHYTFQIKKCGMDGCHICR